MNYNRFRLQKDLIIIDFKIHKVIANLLGIDEFLPSSDFFDLMGQEECQANTTSALVCESILFLICGPDVAELDPV
jgi:hypothetical protein